MSDENKVQRYDFEQESYGYSYMAEWHSGEYVKYADYSALERRARIAERAIDKVSDVFPMVMNGALSQATREIDAELAKDPPK